jgi:hypothetical protein
VFVCAGYFLGHLDGLGLNLQAHAPRTSVLFGDHPEIGELIPRVRRALHELWLSEYGWSSIEVFSPIYDLLCAMMSLHGFDFAKTDAEWRMVMCEDDEAEQHIRNALATWIEQK